MPGLVPGIPTEFALSSLIIEMAGISPAMTVI
jgi:hypothetical protein